MGNRALITTASAGFGIYLHWNGGRNSIEAFLRYAELAELPPLRAEGRGLAQLATAITNFFGNDGNNVALEAFTPGAIHSAGDNGVYLVDGYEIVGRIDPPKFEQRDDNLEEMLSQIDAAQPERDRLGGFLEAQPQPTESLNIGDKVWIRDHFGPTRYAVRTVIGFGSGMVNGTNRTAAPYVDRYDDQDNSKNPNSYITGPVARVESR